MHLAILFLVLNWNTFHVLHGHMPQQHVGWVSRGAL